MQTVRIVLVTAGLGEPSTTALLGENLGEAARRILGSAGISTELTSFSLRSLAKDITNHYLTGFPAGQLATALDAVRGADAIIAVTPVFKASYSGLFKSFWDLVEDGSLAGKPVLIAATGGTARHSLVLDTALRPLFSYLKATVAPSGVFAATDDFGADTSLGSRVERAAGEFAQLVAWTLGSAALTPPASTGNQAGEEVANKGRAKLETVNAGSFFGIAVEEEGAHRKAPGLAPLEITPFEELLKRNHTR